MDSVRKFARNCLYEFVLSMYWINKSDKQQLYAEVKLRRFDDAVSRFVVIHLIVKKSSKFNYNIHVISERFWLAEMRAQ
jgi:hypothetical protein